MIICVQLHVSLRCATAVSPGRGGRRGRAGCRPAGRRRRADVRAAQRREAALPAPCSLGPSYDDAPPPVGKRTGPARVWYLTPVSLLSACTI